MHLCLHCLRVRSRDDYSNSSFSSSSAVFPDLSVAFSILVVGSSQGSLWSFYGLFIVSFAPAFSVSVCTPVFSVCNTAF